MLPELDNVPLAAIDRGQSSHYARAVLESIPDPFMTIDLNGRIADMNEATVSVTGLSRDRLVGTQFANCFSPAEQASVAWRQALDSGSVSGLKLTMRHQDGQLTEVLFSASLYKDVCGSVLGVFAVAHDITAQKQIAEQRNILLERLAELKRFQTLIVGRELKMIELKKEIADLRLRSTPHDVV